MKNFLRIMRVLLVRKVGQRAGDMVREAAGAHNHSMILHLLGREMHRVGADVAPFLLRELIMGASLRKPGYTEYLQHVGDARALAAHAGNDFMSDVLQKSRRYQFDEVVALMTDVTPHKRIYHTEELESRHPAQDYIPLGVRKSMARKPSMDTLESLVREQNPSVIRNLLNNPKTIEEMVIKMASLRPTAAEVLEEISVHPRWSARYPVKKALAFNPYSPPRAVHALLPALLMGDLIEVTLSPTLHPDIRAAAKRFIMHRLAKMNPKEKEQFHERYGNTLKRIFLQVG
ncbi:MAG: hypothetical protein P1S46_00625 [bacterium]|nr:hypothetical protein [bacterium]